MKVRFVHRRTIWYPTWLGWLCLVALLGAPPTWWLFCGEGFLSLTAPESADVLVVEGWIGRAGMEAARKEFAAGGYRWVIATGGYTGEGWMEQRWSYAEMARKELLRLGVPGEKLLSASAGEADTRRTHAAAVATQEALAAHGLEPRAINVLTRGPHGRRSRIVFSKVLGPRMRVGVISWNPPHSTEGRWWLSSERAKELVTETAGYWFEVLAGSGRWVPGSSAGPAAANFVQPVPGVAPASGTLQSP